jgi:branched-chain amino acid transport system permease protein
MRNNMYKWILWVVVIIFVAIFPHVFSIYFTNLFLAFAIYSLYAVTVNLLLGYMGVLSFGHAMFLAPALMPRPLP